jgi:hypothetical protein
VKHTDLEHVTLDPARRLPIEQLLVYLGLLSFVRSGFDREPLRVARYSETGIIFQADETLNPASSGIRAKSG